MDALIFGAALVVVLAVVSAGGAGLVWWRMRRAVLRRRVLVALRTGRAVEGVLVRSFGGELVLRESTVHDPDTNPIRADGAVHIARANVDYVQIL